MSDDVPCQDRDALKKWVTDRAEEHIESGQSAREAVRLAIDEAKMECTKNQPTSGGSCGCKGG